MLRIGRNFCLAGRGRKYTRIMKEWVLLTAVFCTGMTLSLLDLLGLMTILKEVSAASEDAMVELAAWVIDLWAVT